MPNCPFLSKLGKVDKNENNNEKDNLETKVDNNPAVTNMKTDSLCPAKLSTRKRNIKKFVMVGGWQTLRI